MPSIGSVNHKIGLAYLLLTYTDGLLRSVYTTPYIQPLIMKLNVSLKDTLMLVLRKAMFARLVGTNMPSIGCIHQTVFGSLHYKKRTDVIQSEEVLSRA